MLGQKSKKITIVSNIICVNMQFTKVDIKSRPSLMR